VIPAEIREYLKLEKGDKVLIEKKNQDIVLKPVAKLSRLKGIDKGAWKDTSKEIDKMREEWDKEFG
jgi:AbrB family looped-hinge helix DNA binding protein